MSKYEPLAKFLAASATPNVTLSFRQIELILGEPLPPSARDHRPWWGNQTDTSNRPQARAWLEAGWRVGELGVDLFAQTVTFVACSSTERKSCG